MRLPEGDVPMERNTPTTPARRAALHNLNQEEEGDSVETLSSQGITPPILLPASHSKNSSTPSCRACSR